MLEFFGFYVEGCSEQEGMAEPVEDIWGIELQGFRLTPTPWRGVGGALSPVTATIGGFGPLNAPGSAAPGIPARHRPTESTELTKSTEPTEPTELHLSTGRAEGYTICDLW